MEEKGFGHATDMLAQSLRSTFGNDKTPATKSDVAETYIALARANDAILALLTASQSNRAADWLIAREALTESIESVGSGIECLSDEGGSE